MNVCSGQYCRAYQKIGTSYFVWFVSKNIIGLLNSNNAVFREMSENKLKSKTFQWLVKKKKFVYVLFCYDIFYAKNLLVVERKLHVRFVTFGIFDICIWDEFKKCWWDFLKLRIIFTLFVRCVIKLNFQNIFLNKIYQTNRTKFFEKWIVFGVKTVVFRKKCS